MNYKLYFRPEAVSEYLDAKSWYDEQQSGLGDKFTEEVDQKVNLIIDNPYLFAKSFDDIRSVKVKHFPYALLYSIEKNIISILSVFHLKREPDSWQNS